MATRTAAAAAAAAESRARHPVAPGHEDDTLAVGAGKGKRPTDQAACARAWASHANRAVDGG